MGCLDDKRRVLGATGFIWLGGSLGFRFWRVFAREFLSMLCCLGSLSYRCRGNGVAREIPK